LREEIFINISEKLHTNETFSIKTL